MSETTSNVEMAHKISEDENRTMQHGSWFFRVIEIMEGFALALVAVATAWSGYQSALWDGRQAELYGESSKLRVGADADATLAGQQRLYDVITVHEWLRAKLSGNNKLARLFEARFRDEFRVAFNSLGLSPDMVSKFVPVLTQFVQSKGGANAASLPAGALK